MKYMGRDVRVLVGDQVTVKDEYPIPGGIRKYGGQPFVVVEAGVGGYRIHHQKDPGVYMWITLDEIEFLPATTPRSAMFEERNDILDTRLAMREEIANLSMRSARREHKIKRLEMNEAVLWRRLEEREEAGKKLVDANLKLVRENDELKKKADKAEKDLDMLYHLYPWI